MATVQVTIDLGLIPQSLVDQARGTPRLVHGILDAAVNAGGPYLWRQLALATPSGATGLLAQHAYFERTLVGGKPQGFVGYRGAPSLYAYFADQGRAPGRFPPVDAIAYWVARKFGYAVGSADARRIGFLVARKIARQGSKGHHMVSNTVTTYGPRASNIMVRAAIAQVRAFVATGRTSAA